MASFSDLVYTRIWDHQAMHGERTIRSAVPSFDPAAWAGMGLRLDERPANSDGQRYRSAEGGDDQRVLLEKDAWGDTGQCYLWAADDDLLVDLVAASAGVVPGRDVRGSVPVGAEWGRSRSRDTA